MNYICGLIGAGSHIHCLTNCKLNSYLMKKLLLACAAAAFGFGFASAEELTITWANEGFANAADITTVDKSPVSLTFALGENANKNNPKYYNTGNGFRMYVGNTVTVSVESGYQIDEISFTASGTNYLFASTASEGSIATEGTVSTWTPAEANTAEVTFTKGTGTSRITTTVVKYSSTGSAALEPAGLAFPAAEYTAKFPGSFTAPELSKDTDMAATYTSSNEEVATVDAATGAVTIVKPGTTVITATTEANEKYQKGSAKYTLTVVGSASSLADLYELAALDAAGVYEIECPLTVTFVNNRNVYVVDAQNDATLIYMATKEDAANYTEGDVLASGWTVKYSPYFNLPEFVPTAALPTVSSKGATYEIAEVTLAEVNKDYLNKVICIKKVTLPELPADTKVNTTVTNGDASLAFRNTFGLPAFEPAEGEEYNVKGILSIYNEDLQFLPIEISVASGVASIEANEGVAAYYDLNGRQVKGQLQNGLYIKVLNGKATKVIVK